LNFKYFLVPEFWLPCKGWTKGVFSLVLILIMGQSGYAQKKISIHSENNQIIDATFDPPTQYLNGDVKLFHANTFMYCDTAILRGNYLRMRHNVVLLQNDTIKIFADSLRYNGDSLVANFYGDIILENGPTKKLYTSYLKYDVKNKIAYYTKNARLEDQGSVLLSKRGRYVLNDKMAYFYENVQAKGKDFVLIGDSLAYNTTDQRAKFLSPVRIKKDTSEVFSNTGWFDMDDKTGQFIGNAQYLEGKTKAAADTISYDSQLDVVILSSSTKKSEYFSEQDTAYAQVITYNQKNSTYALKKDGFYKSKTNQVKGDDIFYDKKTEKFNVKGRSEVSDPPMIIIADTIDYDKTVQYGKADGKVIWRDTSAKTAIFADHVRYNGSSNIMKASNDEGKPLFTTEMDGDTLFMKADTLKSFRVIKERIIVPDKNTARRNTNKNKDEKGASKTNIPKIDSTSNDVDSIVINEKDSIAMSTDTIFTGIMDTLDYFHGDKNVRIFKSDLQAVCDSLIFSKKDSIFTLYKKPFVWSDSSQIYGDTVQMFLKSKKIDRLKVLSNATILNTEDLKFFNQIQGREINAYFVDNKMSTMYVNGNAQLVYYLKDDDKAYIGVNTSECSKMTFYFEDNKVKDIKLYTEPKSMVYPMKSAQHETLKVKGFIWNFDNKPQDKEDL
jgi:lipopolysaccharide export system protein LptA